MNSGTLEASSPASDVSPAPPAPEQSSVRDRAVLGWSPAARIAFRFLLLYFVLYFFPLASGLSNPEWLSTVFDKPWHAIVTWVGGLFHVAIPTFSNGSGDTTYDYLRIACMAVLALVGMIVWAVLDRRRTEYPALFAWS